MGWKWYQLDQASTLSLIFTGRMLFLTPINSVKALKANVLPWCLGLVPKRNLIQQKQTFAS